MEEANRLEERTYQFALRVLRFCRTLPTTPEGYTIRAQLLRAAFGTIGNYRSARRGRSRREFVAHLGKASDEAAEAHLWLRLTIDGEVCVSEEAVCLRGEATELEAILSRSYATARANLKCARRKASSLKREMTASQDHQITKLPNHQIPK